MKYRAEIDGLRALAVIPVIFYHAGFKPFSGGYVGVDIFFVISGYLITSIILAELHKNNFSLVKFYERRARRILPALFIVIFLCLPAAWLLLLPADMKYFSESLVTVPLFVSNIFFYKTSGYFGSASELKPLIHTWSLAIEEQFYVFFPILLILTWRLAKNWITRILVGIFIVSLVGSIVLTPAHQYFSFYLLPTRSWELLLGGFIAIRYFDSDLEIKSLMLRQCGSITGLILILFGIFYYDEKLLYPGMYALAPTFGTFLIIIFATSGTLVGNLLKAKFLVGIGLISYSAYLWHQPIFAFAREYNYDSLGIQYGAVLIIIIFIFAYLSWKYVERPFRDSQFISRNQVFLYSLICSLLLIIFGLAAHGSNGFSSRFTSEQLDFIDHFENGIPEQKYFNRVKVPESYRFQCDFYDLESNRIGNTTRLPVHSIDQECYKKNTTAKQVVLIWGDSHAQQLYPGLKKNLNSDWQILQVTSSGCRAKLNAPKNLFDYCDYSNWFAFQTILKANPGIVVIGQDNHHNEVELKAIADSLEKVGVKKTIFTGPTPHWNVDLPTIVARKFGSNVPERTFTGLNKDVLELDKKLSTNFLNVVNANYVSIIKYFCNLEGCIIYFGEDVKEGITSWDYGHLTKASSEEFSKNVLVPEILRAFK